jgi:rhomboid protease GluP
MLDKVFQKVLFRAARGGPRHPTEIRDLPPFYVEMQKAVPRPWLTPTLMVVCLGVFAAMAWANNSLGPMSNKVAISFGAVYRKALVGRGEWWRLFTSLFLHRSPSHILNNLFILAVVGRTTEQLFGTARALAIYVTSGVITNVAIGCYGNHVLGYGASASIYGLSGAMLAYAIHMRRALPKTVYERLSSLPLLFAFFLLVFEGLIPLFFTDAHPLDQVKHGIGITVGFILGWLMPYKVASLGEIKASESVVA